MLRRLRRSLGSAGLAALVVTALLGGCKRASIDTVRIGAVLPLSGNNAFLGEGERRAMEMAIEDSSQPLREKGLAIKLLVGDSAAEPAKAVSIANKFLHVDRTQVLFASTTAVANAMLPLIENQPAIMFAMTIAPGITARSERCFRVWPSTEQERELNAALVSERGWKRLGVIYVAADYGQEARSVLARHLGGDGAFVFEESYQPRTTDFRTILTKARPAALDALVIIGYPPDFIPLVKQIRELGFDVPIIGDIGFTFDFVRAALGELANGIIFAAPAFTVGRSDQVAKSFVDRYRARHGVDPSWNEAYSYDTIAVVARAMERAGASDAESLRSALASLETLHGVTGAISFRQDGDAVTELQLVTILDGSIAPLD